ncbi:hypothetical protein O6H91_18G034600 [Diphasiastrum complanatum]|uniref:Uncharacterized protein n=1 Tax=Diphasiastrum complanatum TaxID=34168 RepID=A0ACC2B0Z2_DIPCM|nr:hypothetical protein O6H91_18G034600 [Diphasiastrum complanatum]
MDGYLQHLRSLRTQMNEYEDKVAELTAEQYKQRTAIIAIEKDLNTVVAESNRTTWEIDLLCKQSDKLSKQILEGKKEAAKLDTHSAALAQALELLTQDIAKQSNTFNEKRVYYVDFSKSLAEQIQRYEDYYNSQSNAKTSMENEPKFSNLSSEACAEPEQDAAFYEAEIERTKLRISEVEKKRQEVRRDLTITQEELRELHYSCKSLSSQNDELQSLFNELSDRASSFPEDLKALDFESLEQELNAINGDKAGEEEYLRTMHERLQQIKAISQQISCASCGYEYTLELGEAAKCVDTGVVDT